MFLLPLQDKEISTLITTLSYFSSFSSLAKKFRLRRSPSEQSSAPIISPELQELMEGVKVLQKQLVGSPFDVNQCEKFIQIYSEKNAPAFASYIIHTVRFTQRIFYQFY